MLRNADPQAGFASLDWSALGADPGASYTLEWNEGEGWELFYQGGDTGASVSGLHDGQYDFRVRAADGVWSEPVSFEVHHHPLSRALWFFGMGFGLFIALLVLLARPSLGARS